MLEMGNCFKTVKPANRPPKKAVVSPLWCLPESSPASDHTFDVWYTLHPKMSLPSSCIAATPRNILNEASSAVVSSSMYKEMGWLKRPSSYVCVVNMVEVLFTNAGPSWAKYMYVCLVAVSVTGSIFDGSKFMTDFCRVSYKTVELLVRCVVDNWWGGMVSQVLVSLRWKICFVVGDINHLHRWCVSPTHWCNGMRSRLRFSKFFKAWVYKVEAEGDGLSCMGHFKSLTLSTSLTPCLHSGMIMEPSAEVISDRKMTWR